MNIICIGQSTWDITLPVEGFPEENKKIKIWNKVTECGGGSSNNQAYLLGKWGLKPYLMSPIGNDMYGRRIISELERVNVNTRYFKKIDDIPTTTSYIITNTKKGTRTIITNKNEKMHYDKEDANKVRVKPDFIVMDGNSYEVCLELIKKNPDAVTILDAGNLKPGSKALLKHTDYVICSNDFAREYTGIDFNYSKHDLIKVYDKLVKDCKDKLIITLEKEGCFTKIDNEYRIIPSIKSVCIDSNGAGDIFHGAFVYFLVNGYSYEEILIHSNITGALSVRKIGPKNSIPDLKEVLDVRKSL